MNTKFTRLQDFSNTEILTFMKEFLIAKLTSGKKATTVGFYEEKLRIFLLYCNEHNLTTMDELTPKIIRQFLFDMGEQGRSKGGVHAVFRTLHTFARWYEFEYEPDGWRNPMNKVKAPPYPKELLPAISNEDVATLLRTCNKDGFTGVRDAALFRCLLDTGARAREFLAINLENVDPVVGNIDIPGTSTKNSKPRTVFLGMKSRKALRAYLKLRTDQNPALWVTDDMVDRLTYAGLRQVLRRRAQLAGLTITSLHAFRRAFALNMLRSGVDLASLSKLMGHSDIQVVQKYLKQSTQDLHDKFIQGSPVDKYIP